MTCLEHVVEEGVEVATTTIKVGRRLVAVVREEGNGLMGTATSKPTIEVKLDLAAIEGRLPVTGVVSSLSERGMVPTVLQSRH